MLAGLGATPLDMAIRGKQIAMWCYDLTRRLVPESEMQWGYVAIGSAFVLLAIGAAVSLHKSQPPLPVADGLV